MCADADAAALLLQQAGDLNRLIIVGIRWGALVAAALARRLPRAQLVLWDPVHAAEDFFREGFRACAVRSLASGGRSADGVRSPSGALRSLRQSGVVDVLGFPVYRSLYESAVGHRLTHELGTSPRHLLLLDQRSERQSALGQAPLPAAELADHCRALGGDVTARSIAATEPSWWFLTDVARPFPTAPFVELTCEWIAQQLGSRGARVAPPRPSGVPLETINGTETPR